MRSPLAGCGLAVVATVVGVLLLLNTMGGAFIGVLIGGMALGAHDNTVHFTKADATVEAVDRRCWSGKDDKREWDELPSGNCDDEDLLKADWQKRRRGQICRKDAFGAECTPPDTLRGAANVDVSYVLPDGQRHRGKLRYYDLDEPFDLLAEGKPVQVFVCKKNPLRLKKSMLDQTFCERPGAQGYDYQSSNSA